MNLVDDDRVNVAENFPGFRCQNQIERFRSRDEDVRRRFCDASPLGRIGIAAADRDGWQSVVLLFFVGDLLNSKQRPLKISLNVDPQSLQRRDLENGNAVARNPTRQRGMAG